MSDDGSDNSSKVDELDDEFFDTDEELWALEEDVLDDDDVPDDELGKDLLQELQDRDTSDDLEVSFRLCTSCSLCLA
jgi:hypothetical protein